MSFFSLSHVCTMFENNFQRLLVIHSRNLERNFGWYIYPTFTFGKWTPLKVHFMILSLSESPRGRDFVPKHLNMILELILNSWQIVSHSYRDMCKFVKIRFETYVPAASNLKIDVKKDFFMIFFPVIAEMPYFSDLTLGGPRGDLGKRYFTLKLLIFWKFSLWYLSQISKYSLPKSPRGPPNVRPEKYGISAFTGKKNHKKNLF